MFQDNLPIQKAEKGYVLRNLTLVIIAFASAFFPRIINAAGAPDAINFVHFLIVPIALVVALLTTPTRDRKQIALAQQLVVGLLIFLAIILASALWNGAGVINVFLSYTLLSEPFLMVLAIICIPLSLSRLKILRAVLLLSAAINLLSAFAQHVLMGAGVIKIEKGYTLADAVQGVFFLSGAGNYVSASVSIGVALYYLINAKTAPIWVRGFWLVAAFAQLIISDSKQIILTFLLAWLFLAFNKVSDLVKTIQYLVTFILVTTVFIWCVQNLDIPGLDAFKHWMSRTYLYGPNGEGTITKLSGIRIVLAHCESPVNWFLGLGPGHTIGRLGGWVLREYQAMLAPLGATTSPVSLEAWDALQGSWLAKESSLFVPMFSWAGIWGDLGFLGLAAYLYLGYLVWKYIAKDDYSKFSVITLVIYGFIITQMEEPGQTLTIAVLVGLQWHEQRLAKQLVTPSLYSPTQASINVGTHQ